MRDVVRVAIPAVIMLGSVVVVYRHLGPGDTRLLRATAVGVTGLAVAVAALAWAALGGR